jgi:hypothetical protein
MIGCVLLAKRLSWLLRTGDAQLIAGGTGEAVGWSRLSGSLLCTQGYTVFW